MARSTRERLMRAGLGLALLAAVVAVTFGAGYRASNALLDGASAYVQKDHTVVRVNGESRAIDAQADAARKLAGGLQRLEVVQVAPGVVYVVNNETGAAWRLPTDSMKPEPVASAGAGGEQKAADNPPQMVAGGGRAYLFDKKRGTLTLLEGPSGRGRKEITLPAPATQVVVDGSGTAWALSQQVGELYAVADGSIVARHHVADHAWEPALLTLAGNRPVVYQPVRGVAAMFDRTGQVRAVDVPKEATWQGVDVAAPGADSQTLVVTSRPRGELIEVDFADGGIRRTRLAGRAGHQFVPPVVFHGRVYVGDQTTRQVIVLESGSLRQVSSRPVPGKTRFELFERDGRVWVNDPYDKAMLSFDRDGRPTAIAATPEVQRPESSPPPTEHRPPLIPPVPSIPPTRHSSEPEPGPPSAAVPHATRAPNVVGMTANQAHQTLRAAHLRWRDETRGAVVRTAANIGRVVRQRSNAGEVTIWYPDPSKGSPIEVPDLTRLGSDEACHVLQSITLGCAGTPAPHPSITGVHSQNPAPGTQVSSGTSVTYLYQTVAPAPLNWYKAERVHSRFLSLGGGPTGDGQWNQQPPAAAVYPPTAMGQLGLVEVFQAGCGNCDVQRVYYYANADGRTPAQPSGNWGNASGAEFTCFDPNLPPPQGTVPLMRMFKGDGQQRRWEFVPTSAPQYNPHLADGYKVDKDLCYVWPL